MIATTVSKDFDKPLNEEAARSLHHAGTLLPGPGNLRAGKQAIFDRTWHYIGHESQVRDPGDYLTLDIADESVFVMRGEDGKLRGFFNVCRHRAHRLLEGAGNTRTIVCPYHAWSYHSDGRFRHARFAGEMPGFNPAEFRLPQVGVESVCGLLFVNLDPGAASIADVAPDSTSTCAPTYRRLAEIRPVESFALRTRPRRRAGEPIGRWWWTTTWSAITAPRRTPPLPI